MSKIFDNGFLRDLTAEEEAEIERKLSEHSAPPLSDTERIAALEEELRAAKILLGLEE